ncbi:hypothetical protein DICPUDRAFT_151536 [Dictyostelium purpureum]|uniref:F-box domain-containing protein n=1 Tax=Dictyostelium purpureum TaxID=5786 RepID=F0ZJ36_DICPU|nr:uncharacterized protein DICPUDRAFT_151536 [Dictyostelium purpureum]EGC36059.1 hypothetical protein DICPUDRAFT_151536 [Dictyostelium purpureum]|eukprot:XP_003287434.1 hypothetical protein DICPUDRAFT_151536 [Dictyostelium purpureum]
MNKTITLPNYILSIIIEKVSENEPTIYCLVKLSLVCKKWGTTIIPYHFCFIKSCNLENILRYITKPIIKNGRECKFTDIYLTRQLIQQNNNNTNNNHGTTSYTTSTSYSNNNNFKNTEILTPRGYQLLNGKLQQLLNECNTIQSLSLVNYSLDCENQFGQKLSDILLNYNHYNIIKLELMNLDLVSNGSSFIISSLKNNNCLTELNLSRNYLREKDGILLGDTIRHNKTLKKLNLSFNEFKTSGLKSILENLAYNNTVTELNLEATCRIDSIMTNFSISPPLTPVIQYNQVTINNNTTTSNNTNNNNNNIMNSSNNNISFQNSPINNNILISINNNFNNFNNNLNLNFLSLNSPTHNLNQSLLGTPPASNSWMMGSSGTDFQFSSANHWIPSSPSSNSINSKFIDSLKSLIDNKTLKYLNLSHNTFGKGFNLGLAEPIQYNKSLTRLDLNYLKLDDECGKKIARALKANTSLKSLSLIYNQLGKDTGIEMGISLSFNQTLSELYLSNNLLPEEVGYEFGIMLKVNSNLKLLDLSDNYLGLNGCKNIFESLKNSNNTLKKLYLRNNKIFDENTTTTTTTTHSSNNDNSINIMLKDNKSLKVLDLSYNNIQLNSFIMIFNSLESNSSLINLNLSFNNLIENQAINNQQQSQQTIDLNLKKCYHTIINIFKLNKSIQLLDLQGNCFKDDHIKEINNCLIKNQNNFYYLKSFNTNNSNNNFNNNFNSNHFTSNNANNSNNNNLNNINIVDKKKKKWFNL